MAERIKARTNAEALKAADARAKELVEHKAIVAHGNDLYIGVYNFLKKISLEELSPENLAELTTLIGKHKKTEIIVARNYANSVMRVLDEEQKDNSDYKYKNTIDYHVREYIIGLSDSLIYPNILVPEIASGQIGRNRIGGYRRRQSRRQRQSRSRRSRKSRRN